MRGHTRRFTILAISALLALTSLGVAAAGEHDVVEDDPAADAVPEVVVDVETGRIAIGLPLDGVTPECTPTDAGDDAEDEPTTDPAADGDDALEPVVYTAGDCIEFEIDHPSGKTHHGAVVSTVAKNLHPSMLDGMSKGEIMREVAKSKFLVDDEVDTADVDTTDTDADDPEKVPPGQAKDKAKNKAEKGNNGNGKAKGKNKDK